MANENLVEVLCALKFSPVENEWDSTFFGKYHEIISKSGYTEKKEHKDAKFEFHINPAQPQAASVKGGDSITRMVFSNPQLKSAITLQPYYIAFHKLAPYDNWELLISEIMKPRLNEYLSMGIGKEISEVQCLYLNRYSINSGESVSKFFNFVPLIENAKESHLVFQGRYDIDPVSSVQLKLHTTVSVNQVRHAFFECTSFARDINKTNDIWSLTETAHQNANKAYQSIIKN